MCRRIVLVFKQFLVKFLSISPAFIHVPGTNYCTMSFLPEKNGEKYKAGKEGIGI